MARTLIPLALVLIALACVYALWRLVVLRRKRGARLQQETSLPYEIWYGLRQTDEAAAERFLAALEEPVRRLCGDVAALQPGENP